MFDAFLVVFNLVLCEHDAHNQVGAGFVTLATLLAIFFDSLSPSASQSLPAFVSSPYILKAVSDISPFAIITGVIVDWTVMCQ